MDHYVPKRRIPVTLWSSSAQGIPAHLFLDLDPEGNSHPTLLERLNESSRFVPAAVGEDGRIHLFNKTRLVRVTVARSVIHSDVFARGFEPWREEEAELTLIDGIELSGRVWMPLKRATQRLSDFMNAQGGQFFVLITSTGLHLVNAAAVAEMRLAESAGAPLSTLETGPAPVF